MGEEKPEIENYGIYTLYTVLCIRSDFLDRLRVRPLSSDQSRPDRIWIILSKMCHPLQWCHIYNSFIYFQIMNSFRCWNLVISYVNTKILCWQFDPIFMYKYLIINCQILIRAENYRSAYASGKNSGLGSSTLFVCNIKLSGIRNSWSINESSNF
jgi:hypothetical protein